MWKCTGCQEKIEDSFTVCWNCGTSCDGVPDPGFQSEKRIRPPVPAEQVKGPPQKLECPNCHSHRVIPSVTIIDRDHGGPGELNVGIARKPNAFIFTQSEYVELRARICGSCGHTELFVNHPQRLWEAYQTQQENL